MIARKTIFILLALSSTALCQFSARVRFNTEISEPRSSSQPDVPHYSIWTNGLMLAIDLESELGGPIALVLSYDYQERVFNFLDNPSRDGENGKILRYGLGVKGFVSPVETIRLFAQLGMAINVQSYGDIYNTNPLLASTAKMVNASSAYVTPNLRLGIDVHLAPMFGVSGSAVVIQDEFDGFFSQASAGFFFRW